MLNLGSIESEDESNHHKKTHAMATEEDDSDYYD